MDTAPISEDGISSIYGRGTYPEPNRKRIRFANIENGHGTYGSSNDSLYPQDVVL